MGGEMVTVLTLDAVARASVWSNHWYWILLSLERIIEEWEEKLVGSESDECVRVDQYVYPTVCHFSELVL
jgi:hypothetical protein